MCRLFNDSPQRVREITNKIDYILQMVCMI